MDGFLAWTSMCLVVGPVSIPTQYPFDIGNTMQEFGDESVHITGWFPYFIRSSVLLH